MCAVCIHLVIIHVSPHREGECTAMFTLLILLKTFKFFSHELSLVFASLEKLSPSLLPFLLFDSVLTDSLLSLCLLQECSDSGWQVKAGGSEERPGGCTQTQTKLLEMLLLFFSSVSLSLSLSLSCARLISAIFFSVSLRLPLHACFSAALVYLWKKQKMRKCLAFYLFFCFVNCFLSGFLFSCISSAMKPFTHAPSVSHPSLLSSFPRYRYYDSITTVNDNITVWGSL